MAEQKKVTTPAPAAKPLTAAEWQIKNAGRLAAATDAGVLEEIMKGGPAAAAALLAEVKTDYGSDPYALTRIAAISQFVMTDAGARFRAVWVAALEKRAQEAPEADVRWICRDQLRWCGYRNLVIPPPEDFPAYPPPPKPALANVAKKLVGFDRADKATPALLKTFRTPELEAAFKPAFTRYSADGQYAALSILEQRGAPSVKAFAALVRDSPDARLARLAAKILK